MLQVCAIGGPFLGMTTRRHFAGWLVSRMTGTDGKERQFMLTVDPGFKQIDTLSRARTGNRVSFNMRSMACLTA